MDFDTAVKLIPLYGDARNDDLQAYIDAVAFVIENCESTDKKKYLSIAKIRLRGEVGAAVRRNELNTWSELKQFLRDRGDKQQSDSYLEDQLICIRQNPRETVREFSDRIEKLGHKLIIALAKSGIDHKAAETSTERRMHKSFTKGIHEPIKSILMNRKTISFNDAVKDALSLELDLEEDRVGNRRMSSYAPRTVNSDKKCFNCNKFGHKAVECRNRLAKNVKAIANTSNACYNCGKPGHFARECRLPKNIRFSSKPQHSNQSNTSSYTRGDKTNQGNGRNSSMDSRTEGLHTQHKSGEYKEAVMQK